LKHKQLVNNETIHSYLASLTVAPRVGCLRFELLQAASSVALAFGSVSNQLVSAAFTGLTDHQWQVCYFLYLSHHHVHTHPFNGPLSGTTRVSRYQKSKTNLDFTEARDSEWQWHPLDHMQVCTSHLKARICPADVNKKTNWNA